MAVPAGRCWAGVVNDQEKPLFEGWAVLELMGHRRLAGYVSEQEIAGKGFLRLDVPDGDTTAATQFYSPASVYCLTPTTEDIARSVAKRNQPTPVQRWELPAGKPHPDDFEVDCEIVDDDEDEFE